MCSRAQRSCRAYLGSRRAVRAATCAGSRHSLEQDSCVCSVNVSTSCTHCSIDVYAGQGLFHRFFHRRVFALFAAGGAGTYSCSSPEPLPALPGAGCARALRASGSAVCSGAGGPLSVIFKCRFFDKISCTPVFFCFLCSFRPVSTRFDTVLQDKWRFWVIAASSLVRGSRAWEGPCSGPALGRQRPGAGDGHKVSSTHAPRSAPGRELL